MDTAKKTNQISGSKPTDKHFYKWNPEDKFTFTGKEFSLLYNTLNQILESPTYREDYLRAKQTMGIAQLHEVMAKKLSDAVDFGIAKEISSEIHDDLLKPKPEQEIIQDNIPVEG